MPLVGRHALFYWLWYEIILVELKECIASQSISIQDCNSAFGDIGAIHADLMETVLSFVCVLFGIIKIMALPSTSQNLVYACLASRYVVMLTKATIQQRPPALDLCLFGLDMKGGILGLAISHVPAGPDALTDAIAFGCVTQGKACNTQYCWYHHHISCMMVCNCAYSHTRWNRRGEGKWNWIRITGMTITLDLEDEIGSWSQNQEWIYTALFKSFLLLGASLAAGWIISIYPKHQL